MVEVDRDVDRRRGVRYLTPPTARGRNHIWRGEGTTTLCSRTESRHASYVLSDKQREDANLCLQCARIAAHEVDKRT